MNSREALIALNMLPRIGPIRVRRLQEHLGTAESILRAKESELTRVRGVGPETAKIIAYWEDHIDLSSELNEVKSRGLRILTLEDTDYPPTLRHMYDPPIVLYLWGDIIERDRHALAVVGSRRTTYYGQSVAKQLSAELAGNGFTILSGLARGIDTLAHEGALTAKGRTIAVLGSGLAQLYPPQNITLATKIADGNGAIISEFPLHTAPDKKTFPMRNRIVAAWSSGILVCECPKWSGSIITANLGAEMGKTIYAVPGPIDRPTSAGCNQLIRDGATLVSSAHDILEDFEALPLQQEFSIQPDSTPPAPLSPNEQQIINLLSKEESLIDTLVETSQLPVSTVVSTLLQLEMKRLVRQLPGAHYILR